MPITAIVKLDSAIFDDTLRRQTISNFVGRQAKDLKDLTKRRMIESKPAGRLYRRKGGTGFRRAHRASAAGQRPAIDTGKLLNTVNDRRLGEYNAETTADAPYAGYLQSERLNRPIISDRDTDEAQAKANVEGEHAVNRLT